MHCRRSRPGAAVAGIGSAKAGPMILVGCAIDDIKIEKGVASNLPFYAPILAALLLTTYVPSMSLALPELLLTK
jgi:TRAP-type C4-dicarboxylate transport system permease large subunit